MIIYGWQQLEGIKENILRPETSWTRRDRMIMPQKIKYAANGKRLSVVEKRQIFNSSAGKVQRVFNCIPGKIRNITGVTRDTFKTHLDDWQKKVLDQPRGGGYSERVAADSNGIQHQAVLQVDISLSRLIIMKSEKYNNFHILVYITNNCT